MKTSRRSGSSEEEEDLQRQRHEAALQRARDRNRKRLAEAAFKAGRIEHRYIILARHEVETLKVAGSVTIRRYIWPLHFVSKRTCQYGNVGDVLRIAEDVKFFGRTAMNAMVVYQDDPLWATLDPQLWWHCPAKNVPKIHARFYTLLKEHKRLVAGPSWLLTLELIDKP